MDELILGIDTGGTHTDAVIYQPAGSKVLAAAKAETTHHDLASGISNALAGLAEKDWPGGLAAVGQINLSTTLATNAIAEGLSNKIGLILMGYDADQTAVRKMIEKLPLVETVVVGGSHNFYGQEDEPLAEAALLAAASELEPLVSGWAVSGFFSVKNPGHELRAARLLKSISDKPVTLGRDLSGEYDAVRRAATAALNAGLVVVINRLLDAVTSAARKAGLAARLMVVKGDGSLVSEDWARAKPIETVVSGPAASLLGAGVLGRGFLTPREKDMWVLDVGGTTTDMAFVREGRPVVTPNGATVGPWRTMTTAVETRTRGLGGDSLVSLGRDGRPELGPRRVLPLCRLAARHPEVISVLRHQKSLRTPVTMAARFFLPGAPPEAGLTDDETEVLMALRSKNPLPLAYHAEKCFNEGRRFGGLAVLSHPSIMISAFTPTDALSILGLYDGGGGEASILGAEILGRSRGLSAEQVAVAVLEEFGRLLAQEIISQAFNDEGINCPPESFETGGIFGPALGLKTPGRLRLDCTAEDTVALLGAPAAVLAPFLSRYLKGRIIVPPNYGQASAVGAAAAPVNLSRRVEIHTLPNLSRFRLFLPEKIVDGETVDELALVAEAAMNDYMRRLAGLAGFDQVKISCRREDRQVQLSEGTPLNLGATLSFTARA